MTPTITVYVLAADTRRYGTEATVYKNKADLHKAMIDLMKDDAKEDTDLAALIEAGEVDEAWEYWEEHHRPSLDTYTIEEATVDLPEPYASAPYLLQALSSMMKEGLEREAFVPNDIACINARNAIDKAEGRCTHNIMEQHNEPGHAWKCAKCGYVYGKEGAK